MTKSSLNASVFRFRVGEHRAMAVSDGQATMPAFPGYASNVDEDVVRASLAANHMDPVHYTLNFNALLVDTGRHRVLIDTGAGADLGPSLGRLSTHLAEAGVPATSVDVVVLTHAHPDHIGGLTDGDGNLAFPDAQVFVAEPEWRHWTTDALDFGRMTIPDELKALFRATTARNLGAIRSRVTLFAPGQEIVPGVVAVDARGHTKGHCAIIVASGGSSLVHVGDVFHSQAFDLDNPGWATAFDLDPDEAALTRTRLLDRAAADGSLLMSYHMPFPGLGRVGKEGARFRWFPVPWRMSADEDTTRPA